MHFRTIRERLRDFIFPNHTRLILRMCTTHSQMKDTQKQLRMLLDQIEEAKREIQASGKDIVIKGPVVFLGSIAACQVKVQPEIHQEIVLGRVDLESLINVKGDHQMVSNCIFESQPKEKVIRIVSSTEEVKKSDV